ncbi:MAG: Gfo/Idh/MocA family oxidoreductase [Anaerolineales bacterium]|nr:Gfo/Idh/MocA family oxidoreductase [Anaerolineales bacterium]
MSRILRWGLLSTAKINNALINPIKQAQRSELAAVASRDGANATDYARKHGIAKAYGSYEALLADPEIDAVYISLPNSMHAEWTVKAAQAGKHVLCEKPLVVSLAELDQVEAAAASSGVTVFEAFMYLHHPQTRRALSDIQSGRIGALQTINSWFNFSLPPVHAANVRLQAGLTGGALWDVGVYPNSLAIVMAGGVAPVEVWAQQIIGESGVDVAMRAQLHFENGVVAQISSGFRTPFREAAYLVGDKGIIQIMEPWKPGVTGKDSQMIYTNLDNSAEEVITPAVNPYACEVAAMEACVLDGAAPIIPLSLSRIFARSVLATYESARTGKVVKV